MLSPGGVALGFAIGIVFAFAGVQILRAAAAADAGVARGLLGPSRLSSEVARLSQARVLAVEAAESERRRIERDLHDGFQPRLVSLAAQLGLAIARFDRDTAAARSLLGQAHEEAKTALAGLRDVIRGIHPPVLDERGLDAALSGLVAGCPVPVRVDPSLPAWPDPHREAIAYFVAAEAITNITRHSAARKASVTITDVRGCLTILVEDDGRARRRPGRPGSPGRRRRRDTHHHQPAGRAHPRRGDAAGRVVIADDSVLLREGIARILAEGDIEVIAGVGDAASLLDAVEAGKPDLAVIDVRMPPGYRDEGLRAVRCLDAVYGRAGSFGKFQLPVLTGTPVRVATSW